MRAWAEGLRSPYSLLDLLPAVYQDDPFTTRLTAAWDEVIAPIVNTLDCLDAYFDPQLTPEDLLEWLADRMGLGLDARWPLEHKREAAAHALMSHRACGTVDEVRRRIALATGGRGELLNVGGVFTSRTPATTFPDEPLTLLLRVTLREEQAIESVDVEAVARQSIPAHVPYRTEVVRP
ncbi:phage tail protein I [Streptomyces wuyuanensis]|uniref:phage tail protein I n=1 Tax=Streptomyces wuyuanensis TaxID=1196353 RepID=UPI00341B037A